jgi:hypothetical protein
MKYWSWECETWYEDNIYIYLNRYEIMYVYSYKYVVETLEL